MTNEINWDKPLRLQDGTPVTLHYRGDHHNTLKIDAVHRTANNGRFISARRVGGIIISNHNYYVENVPETTVETVNTGFVTGDHVKYMGHLYRVISTEWDDRVWIESLFKTVPQAPIKVLAQHLIHRWNSVGAPVTKIRFDHHETYQDGWFNGLWWGLKGKFYIAGGPGGLKFSNPEKCRLKAEHNSIDAARNSLWKKGWTAGQAEAKRRGPLDHFKRMQIRDAKGYLTPIIANNVNTADFGPAGSSNSADNRKILENIMTTDKNTRKGFGIWAGNFGGLFDTLEEASRNFNARDRATIGSQRYDQQFIAALTQTRKNGHSSWKTTHISGPIEPMKPSELGWDHKLDKATAADQGWQITKGGHDNYKLLSVCLKPTTADHMAVWDFVTERSRKGDALANRALTFLKDNSREEYDRIVHRTLFGNSNG